MGCPSSHRESRWLLKASNSEDGERQLPRSCGLAGTTLNSHCDTQLSLRERHGHPPNSLFSFSFPVRLVCPATCESLTHVTSVKPRL